MNSPGYDVFEVFAQDMDRFVSFNKEVYPRRTSLDSSIKYKLSSPLLKGDTLSPFLVAVGENNEIQGEIQLVPCRCFFRGREHRAYWGNDYIVKPEFRNGSAGPYLALAAMERPLFGMGLSPMSYKIFKRLGIDDIGTYFKYVYFNSSMSLFKFMVRQLRAEGLTKISYRSEYPEVIVLSNQTFTRLTDYSAFSDRTWFPSLLEFSRDREFMEWRFGTHRAVFGTYCLWDHDHIMAYFVVREVSWRGARFLLLVDHRCSFEQFPFVLKFVKKLAKLRRTVGVISISTMQLYDEFHTKAGFHKYGIQGQIVCNLDLGLSRTDVQKRESVLITMADSDADFFFGDNQWYE